MFQKLVGAFAFIALVLCSVSASAMEFHHIGYEAMSIGGAGVASSKNSFAAYYNPALIPEHPHGADISLSAIYGYREENITEHIDNLADIDIEEAIDDASSSFADGTAPQIVAQDVATVRSELRALSGRNGIQMMPGISLGIQAGNFGFGAYLVSEASASAVVASDHLDLIYEDDGVYIAYDDVANTYSLSNVNEYEARSFEYAIENGLTYIDLGGLAYVEIPFSYGRRFITEYGHINVGASLKIMPGYTFEHRLDIDTRGNDIVDAWEDYLEEDTAFGIDLGLLYKPSKLENLTLGLVAKNLNTPEFNTVSGSVIEAAPLVRAGIAYDLLDERIVLALDADLTKNETFIDDYYSQYIGGGLCYRPNSWLSLRAGVTQNIQESAEGIILTGGLGIGVKWLQINIAGQYGTQSETIDGDDIPKTAKIQVALVSKWN